MFKRKKGSPNEIKLPVKEIMTDGRKAKRAARCAQNALRHGLTTVSRRHPSYHADIVELAKLMCGTDDDPALFEKAAAVAECDILIREIRRYRNRLLERLADPDTSPAAWAPKEREYRLSRMKSSLAKGERLLELHPRPDTSSEDRAKFDELMKEYWTVEKDRGPDDVWFMALPDLDQISRYERRTWSRRKRMLMQYMAYLAGCRVPKRSFDIVSHQG
jgi:hypothetical protein